MSKTGLMTRPICRALLAGAGVVPVGLGAGTSTTPLRDIVQEVQGHCDWVPCVTRMTAVVLVIAFAAIAADAFTIGLAAGTMRRGR